MLDYNSLTFPQLKEIAECLEQGLELTSPNRGIDDFCFSYYGLVVAKERARGDNFYTPTATRNFERAVKEASYRYMVSKGYHQPFAFPVRAIIDIHVAVPENWPRWKQTLAINQMIFPDKQDTDNKVKAIQDGMNKIVFRDDKQVASVQATQVYRRADMFTMRLEPRGLTKFELTRLASIMKSRGN